MKTFHAEQLQLLFKALIGIFCYYLSTILHVDNILLSKNVRLTIIVRNKVCRCYRAKSS